MLFILGPIVLVVFILGLFIANRNEKRWTHMGLLVAASLLIIIGVIYFAIGHGGTHH
uniref:Major facilitator superfamily MFS_1 n=1 Tax=mine drainage metagenome TaxID=410659 RepID=E6PIU2_9ZZZZ